MERHEAEDDRDGLQPVRRRRRNAGGPRALRLRAAGVRSRHQTFGKARRHLRDAEQPRDEVLRARHEREQHLHAHADDARAARDILPLHGHAHADLHLKGWQREGGFRHGPLRDHTDPPPFRRAAGAEGQRPAFGQERLGHLLRRHPAHGTQQSDPDHRHLQHRHPEATHGVRPVEGGGYDPGQLPGDNPVYHAGTIHQPERLVVRRGVRLRRKGRNTAKPSPRGSFLNRSGRHARSGKRPWSDAK